MHMRKRHRHPLSSKAKGIKEYMHKPHTCRGTHNEYNRCELLGIVWARTEGFMGHEARVGTPGYTPGDARNCNAKPTMLAVKIYSSLCIVVTFRLYQVSYSLSIYIPVCVCLYIIILYTSARLSAVSPSRPLISHTVILN